VLRYFNLLKDAPEIPREVPKELADKIRAHFEKDFVAWAWHSTYIRDRDRRRRARPDWTPGQLIIAWRFQLAWDSDESVRLDLLKTRQGGFSTLGAHLDYWLAAFHDHLGVLLAAQDKETTRQIFGYVREIHELQPPWIRERHRYASRLELMLEEPDETVRLDDNERGRESRVSGQTAGKDFLGTGLPTQGLHISEIGKWHKACEVEPTYTSVSNSIQDLKHTVIFRESTAHGAGTYWNDEWTLSMLIGRPGWNGFTPIFLPWYIDPRNVMKVPPGFELGTSLTDEFGNEEQLKQLFDLTDEQLQWRRRTIRKQGAVGKAKVELFKQEHPGTQAEAWLFAFGKFIDADVILSLRADAASKPKFIYQGDIDHRRYDGAALSPKYWMTARSLGPFTVWEKPDLRCEYVVGADVAEGLADGDFSCAKVYKRFPQHLELVAEWWGLAPIDRFSHTLWRIGHWYSTRTSNGIIPALLAWERTGPGAGIHQWLRTGNPMDPTDAYPPARQYRTIRTDRSKRKRDPIFGVTTSGSSKRPMLDLWVEWASQSLIDVITPDVDEAETLEKDDRGLINTNGRDRFMASVIAVLAHRTSRQVVFPGTVVREAPVPGSMAWVEELEAEGEEMKRKRARVIQEDVVWRGMPD
jgi:hypothetical protein